MVLIYLSFKKKLKITYIAIKTAVINNQSILNYKHNHTTSRFTILKLLIKAEITI